MERPNDYYLDGLVNNKEQVIKEMYTDFLPRITHMVKKNSGSADEGFDMFQEGLIVILKKAKQKDFKITSAFFTYLYGVCRYLWSNELQKKYKSEVMFSDTITYKSDEDIEGMLINNEKEALYKEKFAELSEKCQSLLQLFFEKVKGEEIAKRLGYASANSARKQKHHCQKGLIDKIKGDIRYDQ